MRTLCTSILAAGLVLLLCGSAGAIIRINGNQMVEGCGDTREGTVRARGAEGTPAPTLSGPRRIIHNLGQGVMGRGALPGAPGGAPPVAFVIGLGLGYDIANVALGFYCPVAMTGDVNVTGTINAADIIHAVNFVFKSGPPPLPCPAAGDVNCSGTVTAADIISLVVFVFKSGPPPCDVCNLIPGTWSCP